MSLLSREHCTHVFSNPRSLYSGLDGLLCPHFGFLSTTLVVMSMSNFEVNTPCIQKILTTS